MAERRKLEALVQTTTKKVEDGIVSFCDILEKYRTTGNASQRDKLGEDLKKEIKKLQRHRDQIKQWQSGNDVKDKAKLLEYRQKIEKQMEVYKNVEKENKRMTAETRFNHLNPEEKLRLTTRSELDSLIEKLTSKKSDDKKVLADLRRGKTRSRNDDDGSDADGSDNGNSKKDSSATMSKKDKRKNKKGKKEKKDDKKSKSKKGKGNSSSPDADSADEIPLEELPEEIQQQTIALGEVLEVCDFHIIRLSALVRQIDNGSCEAQEIVDREIKEAVEKFIYTAGKEEDDFGYDIYESDTIYDGIIDNNLVAEMTEGSQAAIAQINEKIVPDSAVGTTTSANMNGTVNGDSVSVSLSSTSNLTSHMPDTPTSILSGNPSFISGHTSNTTNTSGIGSSIATPSINNSMTNSINATLVNPSGKNLLGNSTAVGNETDSPSSKNSRLLESVANNHPTDSSAGLSNPVASVLNDKNPLQSMSHLQNSLDAASATKHHRNQHNRQDISNSYSTHNNNHDHSNHNNNEGLQANINGDHQLSADKLSSGNLSHSGNSMSSGYVSNAASHQSSAPSIHQNNNNNNNIMMNPNLIGSANSNNKNSNNNNETNNAWVKPSNNSRTSINNNNHQKNGYPMKPSGDYNSNMPALSTQLSQPHNGLLASLSSQQSNQHSHAPSHLAPMQHKASSLQQNGRVLINEGIKHGSLHGNGKLLSQNGKVSLQNFNARDGSHSSASDSLNGGSSQGYQEGKLQQYYLEEHFSDSTVGV